MEKFEQVVKAASVNSMESKKSKVNSDLSCRGVPLPYLIRSRRTFPVYDCFSLYNDYIEYSSDSESVDDDDESSVKAEESSSLEKGFQIENNVEMGHSLKDETDEEYVFVNYVDVVPNSKTRPGAIQMMELSKDGVGAWESEDEGSEDDGWIVL